MKAILAAAFIEVAVSTAAAVDFLWQEPEEPKLLSQELDRGVLLPIPINPPINPLQLQKMTPFDTVKEWLPVCKAHMGDSGWAYSDRCVIRVGALLRRGNVVGVGCVDAPSGVTRQQAVQVVVRYIEARPERMDENFPLLAFEALADAWPCR